MFGTLSLHTTRASSHKDDDRHKNEKKEAAHKSRIITERLLTRGDFHFHFILVVRMHDVPLIALR